MESMKNIIDNIINDGADTQIDSRDVPAQFKYHVSSLHIMYNDTTLTVKEIVKQSSSWSMSGPILLIHAI